MPADLEKRLLVAHMATYYKPHVAWQFAGKDIVRAKLPFLSALAQITEDYFTFNVFVVATLFRKAFL